MSKLEPSLAIAEGENMPELTVPTKGAPTAAAPPIDNESVSQHNRKVKTFRYSCSPEGYPTVILDKEGITEDVREDPYWTGQIADRSAVLGQGSHWFKRSERAAAWRQQRGLPDRRYTGGYIVEGEDDTRNYYNAPPMKRDPALKKKGPYQQYINGISYVPKALILREQPVVKLFSMEGDDPRQPSLQDLENDRKDPWYQTIANNLTDTRSYSRRTQIGADLLQNRNASNRLSQLRHIKVYAPYGEGIGMSWKPSAFKKEAPLPPPPPQYVPPANVGRHNRSVMESGITPHYTSVGQHHVLGTQPSGNP